MTVGIRCADHATPSIRKSWHYFANKRARSAYFARAPKPWSFFYVWQVIFFRWVFKSKFCRKKFKTFKSHICSRNSPVSVVTRLLSRWTGKRSLIPGRRRDISLRHSPDTSSGVYTAPYVMGTEGYFLALKRPEREAPPSAEVKNACRFTSTPCVFKVRYFSNGQFYIYFVV
jgi:hypothetical protein